MAKPKIAPKTLSKAARPATAKPKASKPRASESKAVEPNHADAREARVLDDQETGAAPLIPTGALAVALLGFASGTAHPLVHVARDGRRLDEI
ncbi:hypothetical protein ACIQX0_21325, partial [Methylobacterium sp. NPDC097213]|uniref:hypothetical protein n=1 Tax=Methylobacterium sp. NPDC097213 TaxID=3364170 RepID=UPI003839EBDB